MSFDARDIRTAMDVYTSDNAYLGTVLRILRGPVRQHDRSASPREQSSRVSGELLGPMPTQPLGNHASIKQSASASYASTADSQPLGDGTLVVGTWWGLVGRRHIPISDVQTISLERVVLKQRKDDLAHRA